MNAWLTCTPRDFEGDERFFARDSGLLCRGFQALGVPCKTVIPGQPRTNDAPDLIRTEYANLESSAWWKACGASGVVLYAWGRPEFTNVARAIRAAGLFLVLNQDSSGVISPKTGWPSWIRLKWHLSGRHGLWRVPAFLAGMVRSFTPGRLGYESGRLEHLRQADVIGAVSPDAVKLYARHLLAHGEHALAECVRLIPHPVSTACSPPAGNRKEPRVVCAGRWDAHWQKRPDLLIEVLQGFLERTFDWTVFIAGKPSKEMRSWHAGLRQEARKRVDFAGEIAHGNLIEEMRRSRVVLCTSAYESFHITSAEMLCCGGSVVAVDSPLLNSFRWFTSERSGRLAAKLSAASLLETLVQECQSWDAGQRDAAEISRIWSSRLHAPAVARTVLAASGRSP